MDVSTLYQRFFNITLILALTLYTYAIPLPDYENMMKFNCPDTPSCSCSLVFSDYEIQCPAFEPQIVVRVQPSAYVQIECTGADQTSYALLPAMNIGDVIRVQIRRCPLPLGMPIQNILDRLGTKKFRALFFESYTVDLGSPFTREHLKGLSELERLVLSGNGISDLPEDIFADMANLTWLNLKANKINLPHNIFTNLENLDYLELCFNLQHLEPGIFRNQKRLKHLNLWRNNLRNLSKEGFQGVSSVTDLELSSNGIESLKPDVFALLTNLTILNLSANNFTSLPEGLFSDNKKLRHLRLLENRVELSSLPPYLFSNLTELEDVRIKCYLKIIPENLFEGSINLRNVSLSNNLIETIPGALFADQSNLLDLDLSHNKLTELPDDLFANTRSLLVLSLSYNELVNISRTIFSNLYDLREIHLNNNKLYRIHPNAFVSTRSLQVINLQNNQLSFKDEETGLVVDFHYDFASPFQYLTELRSLNLRNNSITNMYRDWMFNMGQLQDLDLSYNNITMLYHNDLQFLSRQITVNLTHNLIGEINFRDIEVLDFESDPRQVTILVDYNPLVCDCIILHFVQFIRKEIGQNVKKILHIAPKNLQCASPSKLEGRSISQVHPKELLCPLDSDFSSIKKCPSSCVCHVRLYDKALIVNCSNSNLTKVPLLPKPIPLRLDYIELHVENNNIVKLPKIDTPGYADVKYLYAKNNNISQIGQENIPKNLDVLDLAENNLEKINASALKVLNQTRTLNQLYLSNNPWICDCDTNSLVSFVRTNFKKIHDLEKMQCTSGVKMADILPGDLCARDETILIVTSVTIAILGLCVGILAALYYKYQQEVKVWLFAHNMCLWFVTEAELDKDKKYDAFISYSHKDEDFITEHLVPELESGPNPFKLCLHIRDWVVGEFIPNQIAKSVEDSRRTIVILSPNFLESVWGRMEFRAAHTAALTEGRARVIVLIYGDIGDTQSLDPELKAYLKMNTYVKWGDPWFWDKLRYAMPHPVNVNSRKISLIKTSIKSSTDDKLELIKPSPVTPPLTTPPAEQASKNPLVAKLNGEINQNVKISNGITGHVNGAFIINTNAKQSDV